MKPPSDMEYRLYQALAAAFLAGQCHPMGKDGDRYRDSVATQETNRFMGWLFPSRRPISGAPESTESKLK